MEHGLRLLASLTERTVSADVQRVKLSVYNFQLHCQKHLRKAEEEEEEEEIYWSEAVKKSEETATAHCLQ